MSETNGTARQGTAGEPASRTILDAGDAIETARAAAQDLAELASTIPVGPEHAEHCARICDRLAEDVTEVAGWFRRMANRAES